MKRLSALLFLITFSCEKKEDLSQNERYTIEQFMNTTQVFGGDFSADEKTILIFDEFLMNKNWELDEYKALNEFCNNLGYSYEVIAVSFFTKQVAIKLKKLST